MSASESFDRDELLAHAGWVRAMAERVTRDAHAADDLTQDALLLALRGDVRPHSPRAWFAAVVRRLGVGERRGERRRARRQAAAMTRDGDAPRGVERATAGTADVVARAEIHRRVVEAVLDLDEPWRTTLLSRFFEELPTREVARRMGTEPSTVSTRTRAALRRLRERLDDGSDASPWWAVLASPLAEFAPSPAAAAASRANASARAMRHSLSGGVQPLATTIGVSLMKTKGKLAVAALVLACVWLGRRALTPSAGLAPAAETELARILDDRAEVELESAPTTPGAVTRVEVEPEARPTSAGFDLPVGHPPVPELVDRRVSVRGQVIDVGGHPIAGIGVAQRTFSSRSIRVSPPTDGSGSEVGEGKVATFGSLVRSRPAPDRGRVLATTDPEGRFQVEGRVPLSLVVASERYATFYAGSLVRSGEREALIVVAARIPLAGIVVDERGRPLADVPLDLAPPARPLQIEGRALGDSEVVHPTTTTGADGRFAFEDAYDVDETTLRVRHSGYALRLIDVPPAGDAQLRIVLTRGGDDGLTIAGRVVDAQGEPVAGAHVAASGNSQPVGAHGWFAVEPPIGHAHFDRTAPVELTAVAPGRLPATMTLPSVRQAERDGWPSEIVLQLGDAPLRLRGRAVDENGRGLAGVRISLNDPESFGFVEGTTPGWGQRKSVEQMIGTTVVHSGTDGGFEIGGLLPRAYRVQGLRRPSMQRVVSEPFEAGAGVLELVFDSRRLTTLAGRIVDRDGRGIEGVSVAVTWRDTDQLHTGDEASSDSDGRFELIGVTADPEMLRLTGGTIVPELFRELEPDAPLDDLELAVALRCQLQIDWGDPPVVAEEARLVDEAERALEAMILRGNSMRPVTTLDIHAGLSDVITCPDSARAVVLYRGGEAVDRRSLSPRPNELSVVRF